MLKCAWYPYGTLKCTLYIPYVEMSLKETLGETERRKKALGYNKVELELMKVSSSPDLALALKNAGRDDRGGARGSLVLVLSR